MCSAIVVADCEVGMIRYALLVIQAGLHNGVETILSRICENRILCQKLIQIGIWRITARTQMIERVLETILGRNITLSKTALLGIIHNSSKLKIRQNLFADGNVVIVASVTESYKECLVLLFAVTPFAVIRCDRRRDFDFAVRQSIVLFALLSQRYLDDDFVVRNTIRGFVFRLEGVAVCRDSNFAPIGELEFNGRKNGARFFCAVIDLCVIVRGELRLEGDRGFLRGRGHVDRDADAGGEAVCAFARFKNQVIDTILDVFQRECLAVSGSFALALVIPAAGDLGFVHRQTVLVGRENGAERNVLAHIYAFHRIAAIGRFQFRVTLLDLHRERRVGDDHVGNCFSGIAVDPFQPTIREIEIAAFIQKRIHRAALGCVCDCPIASRAAAQFDIFGIAGQRIDRPAVVRNLNLRCCVGGLWDVDFADGSAVLIRDLHDLHSNCTCCRDPFGDVVIRVADTRISAWNRCSRRKQFYGSIVIDFHRRTNCAPIRE